jgi:hypothetical protein
VETRTLPDFFNANGIDDLVFLPADLPYTCKRPLLLRPDQAQAKGAVLFIIVDDSIEQSIFERSAILSLIDEHGKVIVFAVIGPVQCDHLGPWWGEIL